MRIGDLWLRGLEFKMGGTHEGEDLHHPGANRRHNMLCARPSGTFWILKIFKNFVRFLDVFKILWDFDDI